MRRVAAAGVLLALTLSGCGSDPAGTAAEPATASTAPAPKLVRVGTFNAPVFVTAAAGDRRRLYVVEQGGTIRVIRDGRRLARPFLDIRSLVTSGGEQGLLGLAFAPGDSNRFYVNYSARDGDQHVVEYRRSRTDPDRADPHSARLVLVYPGEEPNHNAGQLVFGPDRLLYVPTGDGGGENDHHGTIGNGQSLTTLLGKLLRIDPRPSGGKPYSVPADNPFVGRAGVRPEIYAYGLRNPWRIAFDPRNGGLAIADVGQDAVEEIDYMARGRTRGANFGWRPFEGRRRNYDEPAPGAVPPVFELSHADGNCSITGGVFVRDPALRGLTGRYLYADFCKGEVRSIRLRPGAATDDRALGVRRLAAVSSFGEDASHRVYVVSLNGPVYRLAAR